MRMPRSGATSFRLEADRSPFVSKGKSMKIAALIARFLLGLVFFVFGLNGFLHFIPMQPLPPGAAGQFVRALLPSHYFLVVSALQLSGGVLLLLNPYVALAVRLCC